MEEFQGLVAGAQDHYSTVQKSILGKLFLASIICCVVGAGLMAVTSHFLMMGVYLGNTRLHRYCRPVVSEPKNIYGNRLSFSAADDVLHLYAGQLVYV